jgi:hypothetical protein
LGISGDWDRRVSRKTFLGIGGVSAAALALTPPGRVGGRAGYGRLYPDPDGIVESPKGFQYRIISPEGSTNGPASRGPMEALTNPIFLEPSPRPAGDASVDAPVEIGGPDDENNTAKARYALLALYAAVAILLAIFAASLAGPETATAARPGTEAPDCASGVDFIGFSDALNKDTFEGTSVGGLSGLAYDRRRGLYYSIVDNQGTTDARFYTLRAPVDRSGFGTPEVLDVTVLRGASGEPFTGADFDGEGITLSRKGDLFIASETEPQVRRFSRKGKLVEELPVPQRFLVGPGGGRTNQTFESLALSPNNRSLFTANEGYLVSDGETADGSDRIRILRYEDRGAGGFEPAEEFYYLADPGLGVVEIVALSESELLVLERGFRSGFGNTVRVYRVSLDGAEDVSDVESLATAGIEPLEKELLVDLADCPSSGATTPGTQPNPLLDNYESLTLGPRLPGGRRSLLIQSDDNFSAGQVTRVVALGLENGQLR